MIRSIYKKTKRAAYRYFELPLKNRNFKQHTPILDEIQTKVLESLRKDGIAIIDGATLLSNDLLQGLNEEYNRFYQSHEVQISLETGKSTGKAAENQYKQFNLRASVSGSISFEDNLMQVGFSDRIGSIASMYLNEQAILRYADYWLSLPLTGEARKNSQNWHRDPEDQRIVKVFIYLNDVTSDNGAFEYIKGSHLDGPYNQVFPFDAVHHNNYPEESQLKELIPSESFTVNKGKKGTLIICDTHGFHRGGYCTTNERRLMTMMYNRVSLCISNQFKSGNRSALSNTQRKFHAQFG